MVSRIHADLCALADQSVATLRKQRRRWSEVLRCHSGEDVVAIALQLFERFQYRWFAYELVACRPRALGLVGPHNIERFAGQRTSCGDVDQFGVLAARVKREVHHKLATGIKQPPGRGGAAATPG